MNKIKLNIPNYIMQAFIYNFDGEVEYKLYDVDELVL